MIVGGGAKNLLRRIASAKTDHTARDNATARNRAPRPSASGTGKSGETSKPNSQPTTSEMLMRQRTPLDNLRGDNSEPDPSLTQSQGGQAANSGTSSPDLNLSSQSPVNPSYLPSDPRAAWFPPPLSLLPTGFDSSFLALKATETEGVPTPSSSDDDEIADAIIEDVEQAVEVANTTDGDTRQQAVLDATRHLERIEEIESPAVRERVLVTLAPQLLDIGERIDHLDGDQTNIVIASLARTGESLGSVQVSLLAEPIGHGFSVGTRRHTSNPEQLRSAVQKSVEAGDGTLFGLSLLANYIDLDSGRSVLDGLTAGLQTLNDNFESALADKQALDQRVAGYIARYEGIRSEEQLNLGVLAVYGESQSVIDAFEDASEKLASALDGVSLLPPNDPAESSNAILTEADRVKANFVELGKSEVGRELIADAIVASGSGEQNFFTRLGSFGVSLDTAKGHADDVVGILFDSLAARATKLIEVGDAEGAAALFRGFENADYLLGVSDRSKLTVLTESIESADLTTARGRARFANSFATRAGEVDGRYGTDGDSRLGRSFQVLGVVVGAAAFARTVFDNRPGQQNPEELFRGIVDAAGLPKDFADALSIGKGNKIFSALGHLAKLGIAFDAVDFVRAVQAGDAPTAGLALAALVGGILSSTSLGGPPGTVIGGVLSVFAVAGTIGLNLYRKGQAENAAEGELETFLTAAEFDEDEVGLLRDVNPDTILDIIVVVHQIAAERPDLSPKDVLELLLSPGEHRADEFGGFRDLDAEGNLIIDNRQRLVDAIEQLDRTENGNFTPEAVQEATRLFERYLGVFVDPTGYSPESAIQGLDDEFSRLDLNSDGLVTRSELETLVETHGIPDGFIGPISNDQLAEAELARLPQYLLDREALFRRLDAGSGSRQDGQISVADVAEIVKQNDVIETIIANRETFDTANKGGDVDGIISIDDLKAIRDGDYDDELIAAATYLLEHDDFRTELTDAEHRESREIDIDVRGIGDAKEISLADLAARRLELGIDV